MKTWYRTRWGKIEPVEVIRATKKFVVVQAAIGSRERKEAKESDWSSYFETWEGAHGYLMEKARRKVESLRLQLQQANGELGNIKGMKPPSS